MKVILLATWPNGQTHHIYSAASRLIAKSKFNEKLRKQIIEVSGPDAKFISECIWRHGGLTTAIPMVVDENYDPITLGSELGPVQTTESIMRSDLLTEIKISESNEPNKEEKLQQIKEVRQQVQESRELPNVQKQPDSPKPEAGAEVSSELTVDDEDPEAGMSLEEVICKRISEFGKLKVKTLAANLGETESNVIAAIKSSSLVKASKVKGITYAQPK